MSYVAYIYLWSHWTKHFDFYLVISPCKGLIIVSEDETRVESNLSGENARWGRKHGDRDYARCHPAHSEIYSLAPPGVTGPRGRVRGWNYALVYFAPWVSCKQLRRREPRLGGKITFPIHETSVIQRWEGDAGLSPEKSTRVFSPPILVHTLTYPRVFRGKEKPARGIKIASC